MTMVVRLCQNSTSTPSLSMAPIPPIPLKYNSSHVSTNRLSSRRNLVMLLSLGAVLPCLPQPLHAFAFNIGISGPKDWLKEQKKKSIKYLLAPIDASRAILRYARQFLLTKEYEQNDLETIKGLLRSAARDCVPEDWNSIVGFQAKTGVEVCTFKLILKNASSLLDDNDPIKVEAEVMLSDLIRSFSTLNGATKEANLQLVSKREKVADALMETLSSLDKFELGIKGCISV